MPDQGYIQNKNRWATISQASICQFPFNDWKFIFGHFSHHLSAAKMYMKINRKGGGKYYVNMVATY